MDEVFGRNNGTVFSPLMRYAAVEAVLAQLGDGCRAAHAAADDHQPRLAHRPMST